MVSLFLSIFFLSLEDYLMRDTCGKSQHASFLHLSNAENSSDSGFVFGGHSKPCKIWCEFSRRRRRGEKEEEEEEKKGRRKRRKRSGRRQLLLLLLQTR